MTSCRTETETINRMQKAGPDRSIVVAAISQWRCRFSACVSAHSRQVEHILWCLHGSVC